MGDRRRLKVILILLSLVVVYASFAWADPKVISGFPFERFGRLSYHIETNQNIIRGYRSFPFAAGYLATVSTIAGLSVLETAYIPMILLFSFVCLLLFTKFIGHEPWTPLIAGGVFAFWFYDIHHFQEYPVAMCFYLLFAYFFYKHMTSEDDNRFFGIALIAYISTKFYGQPFELWSITLAFLVVGLILVARRYSDEQAVKIPYQTEQSLLLFGVFATIIFFAYNQKLYAQFLTYRMDSDGSILVAVLGVVYSIFSSSNVSQEFIYVTPSPFLVQRLNTFWALIVVAILGFAFLYYFPYSYGKYWKEGIATIFALAVTAASSVKMVVYSFVEAGLPLRYVVTVWPLTATYFLKKRAYTLAPYVAIVLFVIPLVTSGMGMHAGLDRPFTGEDRVDSADQFLYENTQREDSVQMGHRQYGEFRAISGQEGRIQNTWQYAPMHNEDIQALYLPARNSSTNRSHEYVVLNHELAEYPLQAGPPLWRQYEPISRHEENITNARTRNKVYESNSFWIYQEIPDENQPAS